MVGSSQNVATVACQEITEREQQEEASWTVIHAPYLSRDQFWEHKLTWYSVVFLPRMVVMIVLSLCLFCVMCLVSDEVDNDVWIHHE